MDGEEAGGLAAQCPWGPTSRAPPTPAPVDMYPGKACTLETSERQVAVSPWELGSWLSSQNKTLLNTKDRGCGWQESQRGIRELCLSCEWQATAVRACINPVRWQMVRPGEGPMLPESENRALVMTFILGDSQPLVKATDTSPRKEAQVSFKRCTPFQRLSPKVWNPHVWRRKK